MEFQKPNDQCVEVILTPKEVESVVRQFICTCNPEYAIGWALDAKFNVGSVVFVGTKD